MQKLIEKLEYSVSPRETLSSVADLLGGMLPIEQEEYHIPLMNYVPAYFENSDAKVRKNAARVLGFVNDPLVPSILIRAFQKENVLFVRPQYLKSLKRYTLDEAIIAILQERREFILSEQIPEDERKHYNEELQCIEDCLGDNLVGHHSFTGWSLQNELVMVCDKAFIDMTAAKINEAKKKILPSGVYMITNRLDEYMSIRSFRELLFFLPNLKSVDNDPYAAAKQLIDAGFINYLRKRHEGEGAFRYRLEIRGVDEKKKAVLVKRFAGEILRISEHELIMSKDNYEMELRFVLKEDGTYRFFFKLFTLEDSRFAYRKQAVAASIKPVTAAAFLEKYKDYLVKDAQVLDPFCGVGTMIMERNLLNPVKIAFGIDTYGEAIDKARANCNESEYPIYYIHRDFFDFHHDSLFDEVVTDMPFTMNPDNEEEITKIENVYSRFFVKVREHLVSGAYILMLSRNPEFVRKYCSGGYRIEECLSISEKTNLTGFVIKKL